MFKSVPVSYPKRRKKKHEHVLNEVQEPVRRTMYDIIMENFRYLKRVSTVKHNVIRSIFLHKNGKVKRM